MFCNKDECMFRMHYDEVRYDYLQERNGEASEKANPPT